MTFAELVDPDKAVIKAHGQAPGSAVDADAQMQLSDGPDGTTVMDWNADVNIAGTLAGVGARLIDGTANKMIGQTFISGIGLVAIAARDRFSRMRLDGAVVRALPTVSALVILAVGVAMTARALPAVT